MWDLFCAGAKVSVVGIGGLGHLAIQFASKMGAEVRSHQTVDVHTAAAAQTSLHYFEH